MVEREGERGRFGRIDFRGEDSRFSFAGLVSLYFVGGGIWGRFVLVMEGYSMYYEVDKGFFFLGWMVWCVGWGSSGMKSGNRGEF